MIPRRHKWGARPVYDISAGKFHASKGEREYEAELEMLVGAGEIGDLQRQVKVVLLPARGTLPEIAWTVDWRFVERERLVWCDFHPVDFSGRDSLLRDLWRWFGPGLLRIVKRSGRRFTVRMEIMGDGLHVQDDAACFVHREPEPEYVISGDAAAKKPARRA